MANLLDQGTDTLRLVVEDNVRFMREEFSDYDESDRWILNKIVCDDLEVDVRLLTHTERDILDTLVDDALKEIV